MPLVHITIDTATKDGMAALAKAGHRTFAAEARWALSWWMENGGHAIVEALDAEKKEKEAYIAQCEYSLKPSQDEMRASIQRFEEAERKNEANRDQQSGAG